MISKRPSLTGKAPFGWANWRGGAWPHADVLPNWPVMPRADSSTIRQLRMSAARTCPPGSCMASSGWLK